MTRRPVVRTLLTAGALTATLGALDPAAAQAAPAPAPLRSAGSASSVLIVHVARSGAIRSLARRLGDVRVQHTFAGQQAFSVRVPARDVPAEVARLRALPGVTSVERGVRRTFTGTATPATNDPRLSRQQAYLDAVHAPAAWARQHSAAGVVIAVLDSGVDVSHPDLQGKIVETYNAADPTAPMTDEVGHGTFVAGVAAAGTNNGVGVAGAGYDASIAAVKIADSAGMIQIDDEVAGIRWAADHGANIINLSLGGPDPSSAERSAIAYAQSKGVLVVAAAGNDADSAREYPAAYPGVIAVGATDTGTGRRAAFSTFGSWVTVAAPGVHIYSTVPPGGSQLWSASESSSGYASGDGTSFSTPLVAGELALLEGQNPHATAYQLRSALIASASGYRNQGLGAGQVDFTRGLAHVPPASAPADLGASAASGRVTLTASSTAPMVAFRVDDAPRMAPVAVTAGRGRTGFATWGYRNGPHTLRAYDCSAFGECSYAATATSFTVANASPTIATPAPGAVLTGRITVRAGSSSGGPLRLLLDGRPRGAVDTAPYTFEISASELSDGPHTLVVQGCTTDHHHCLGPSSTTVAVTTAALHPRITGLSPTHVSPNGDGVRDTAALSFTLPDTELVRVRVLDAREDTVRSAALGRLGAGRYRWTFSGLGAGGHRLADGTYTLALDTSSGARSGWVSRSVVVDDRGPTLTRPSGAGTRFYPYPDHYRDTFTTRLRVNEPVWLALAVRDATGRIVRTVSGSRPAGPVAAVWDGRDRNGHRVAAGTYHWQLTATDGAGNHTTSASYQVFVSAKRLLHRTLTVTAHAARYTSAGGTASCALASRRDSAFRNGLRLVNGCSNTGFDLAFASYSLRLPPAVRYSSVTFQMHGFSRQRPSEITAAFDLTDGSVEIPRYLTISRRGLGWFTIATVPALQHVSGSGRVHVTLMLDSYYSGRNDVDVSDVRVRVAATVLR